MPVGEQYRFVEASLVLPGMFMAGAGYCSGYQRASRACMGRGLHVQGDGGPSFRSSCLAQHEEARPAI